MGDGRQVLDTAKAALDSGLITNSDYDSVKDAFLRAQQIKAGLDAGFIRESDYNEVKQAFLHSLRLHSAPAAAAALGMFESASFWIVASGSVPRMICHPQTPSHSTRSAKSTLTALTEDEQHAISTA